MTWWPGQRAFDSHRTNDGWEQTSDWFTRMNDMWETRTRNCMPYGREVRNLGTNHDFICPTRAIIIRPRSMKKMFSPQTFWSFYIPTYGHIIFAHKLYHDFAPHKHTHQHCDFPNLLCFIRLIYNPYFVEGNGQKF